MFWFFVHNRILLLRTVDSLVESLTPIHLSIPNSNTTFFMELSLTSSSRGRTIVSTRDFPWYFVYALVQVFFMCIPNYLPG